MTAVLPPATLRTRRGALLDVDASRWLAPASAVDARVLALAAGPVLDVGCGPGRHVRWLLDRGVAALGIDVTPEAVAYARARGARARNRCVFAPLPGEGWWRTVLLLDGNVGIGGDPVALLDRCRSLLRDDGCILVELAPAGVAPDRVDARLELGGVCGPWFAFATVPASRIDALSARAGLHTTRRWHDGGRFFARLEADPRS